MTTKIDPRSATKKAKDAIYAALPVAIIIKPLRFINANTAKVAIKSPTGEVLGYAPSPEYQQARIAADRGNGIFVKTVARQALMA